MHEEDAHSALAIQCFLLFPQFLKSVLKVRKILHEWSAGIFPGKDLSTGSYPELRGTFLFCPFLLHLKKNKKRAAMKRTKKPTNPAANSAPEPCCCTQAHAMAFKHFPGSLCVTHIDVVDQAVRTESSCAQAWIWASSFIIKRFSTGIAPYLWSASLPFFIRCLTLLYLPEAERLDRYAAVCMNAYCEFTG